jgi:hypothetical protein
MALIPPAPPLARIRPEDEFEELNQESPPAIAVPTAELLFEAHVPTLM